MDVVVVVCGIAMGAGVAMMIRTPRTSRLRRIRLWLDSAGLAGVRAPVAALVLATVGVLVASAVSAILPIPALAPLAGIAGVGIPVIAVANVRDARRITARAAWPDIIDSIRVALRSGSTITEAFLAAEPLVPRAWAADWRLLNSDLHRGAPLDHALAGLRRSLADPVADRVIESILVGRELGGAELPVVLAELARGVRRDGNLRREIRARQSWVRNAARLGVAAPWVVLLLLASRPENRVAYSSATGTVLIIAVAGATIVAHAVMAALGSLRESPRWLTGADND